jgi:hypothetical protein
VARHAIIATSASIATATSASTSVNPRAHRRAPLV